MKKILFAALMLVSLGAVDCQAQSFGKIMKSAAKGLGKVLTTPTTDSSSSSSDTGSSAAPAASGTSFASQSMGEQTLKISRLHPDLNVKVTRCYASGKDVYITLTLENLGEDDVKMELHAWGDATVIDDTGAEHPRGFLLKASGQDGYHSGSTFNLVSGVKKKIDIHCENISSAAESIARIDINANSRELGIESKYLVIKNIPISRDEE